MWRTCLFVFWLGWVGRTYVAIPIRERRIGYITFHSPTLFSCLIRFFLLLGRQVVHFPCTHATYDYVGHSGRTGLIASLCKWALQKDMAVKMRAGGCLAEDTYVETYYFSTRERGLQG